MFTYTEEKTVTHLNPHPHLAMFKIIAGRLNSDDPENAAAIGYLGASWNIPSDIVQTYLANVVVRLFGVSNKIATIRAIRAVLTEMGLVDAKHCANGTETLRLSHSQWKALEPTLDCECEIL